MDGLTVGMATYGDYDGVYFTLQSLRLHHVGALENTEFVVVDNKPSDRVTSRRLQALGEQVPHFRYVPFDGYASTAVRDAVFRYARMPVVMCLDSHVLLAPGALAAAREYFHTRPSCRDLLQGPLLDDSLSENLPSTHWLDQWQHGMRGVWAYDPRGQDPGGLPFEIGIQGLGLFACRREFWPGLNPRLRGHGGEEGYLHEKVRRNGGRVICHPAVRWAHRFLDSFGGPQEDANLHRIRNYLIAHQELGWKTDALDAHVRSLGSFQQAEPLLRRAHEQASAPLAVFDAIFHLVDAAAVDTARNSVYENLETLDIAWLTEVVSVVGLDRPQARAATLASIAARARQRALRNFLVIDGYLPHCPTQLSALALGQHAYLEVLEGRSETLADVQSWVSLRARRAPRTQKRLLGPAEDEPSAHSCAAITDN